MVAQGAASSYWWKMLLPEPLWRRATTATKTFDELRAPTRKLHSDQGIAKLATAGRLTYALPSTRAEAASMGGGEFCRLKWESSSLPT